MLKWVIVVETAVLLAAIAFLIHNRLGAAYTSSEDRLRAAIEETLLGGRRPPFAVCWTNQPLGAPRRPRVMVCKSAHVMTVFDGERALKSYRVAVGGGRGDKVKEGDRCTPEGRFYVCNKNPQSQYTLALGLSYPSAEDAKRGLAEGLITRAEHDGIVRAIRRRTRPPWNTALGGEIMIHGNGAGRDWTAGCIALDDDHIREVYPALPLGTPVTIVP
jgi:lipoprotein-anchoring transpeptidase ErfK/SrfK